MVRYLHPADHHPARNRLVGRFFGDELDFEYIKFAFKIRDILKIKKKDFIPFDVFGYEIRKNIQFMYQKNAVKRNMLIYY